MALLARIRPAATALGPIVSCLPLPHTRSGSRGGSPRPRPPCLLLPRRLGRVASDDHLQASTPPSFSFSQASSGLSDLPYLLQELVSHRHEFGVV
ncbi:hypothetical protein TRIUR3_29341 [Triticum urartu]|uniref:Uncharacterized protein n=1 Tax=Triticum urartu TaxID=4572 RepID=M8A765_TRIUA|nr:hypothetical protein TRIUR3_29341 [Triticum urartu]